MRKLYFTETFDNSYKALIKRNKELEKRTNKAVRLMMQDPFYASLKTHKVNTKNYGLKYSSRVTGGIRIIWDFDPDKSIRILLLDIGSHKLYK